MFVYYLDGCLTAYWQLFTLSLWLITLLFIVINARKLLRAKTSVTALKEAGITGAAYDRLRPAPGKNLRWLVVWCTLSLAVLYGYNAFFSTFQCTPDSVLWISPERGPSPAAR